MLWMLSAATASAVSGAASPPACSPSVAQWDGLVFGDVNLFLAQLAGIGISIAVAVVGTLICAGIVRIFTKLRVEPKEELIGMDTTQHGENAYPSFNGLD